jgi:hypothetical protein
VYAIDKTPGCNANFLPQASNASVSAGPIGPRDKTLLRTAEALRLALSGEKPKAADKRRATSRLQPTPTPVKAPQGRLTPLATPTATPPAAATPTPVPVATPTAAPADPADGMLDYLFGKDPR